MSKHPVSDAKIPVSRRAIIQRINRKLSHSRVQMCKNRREDTFYLVDMNRKRVVEHIMDLEEKARELEVLMPWEEEADERGK